jgi:hypothetical protein
MTSESKGTPTIPRLPTRPDLLSPTMNTARMAMIQKL